MIVLSNNDGSIVAANRQAKELGIKKFGPYFKVKQKCEQLGITVRSSNYELYSSISSDMMQVISRFGHNHFEYSIDECFLDLSGYNQIVTDIESYGRKIRRAVYKETRIPTCVGIAKTATLTKIANRAAKTSRCHRGVAVIDNEAIRKQLLSQTLVNQYPQ